MCKFLAYTKNDSHTSFPVCARMKEVTCTNKLISGIICFETLISEPSLHKMSPRLLNSTTDYGQPSCFEHLGVQLNVNNDYRFY